MKIAFGNGIFASRRMFSYGQRSKCADLLDSYLLPVQLAKVFTGLPHGKYILRSLGPASPSRAAKLLP